MGPAGDGHHNEGIAQHSSYINSKKNHKQDFQEEEFLHVGVVALDHDGEHPLLDLLWVKIF